MSMNSFNAVGRLTKDPELKKIQRGDNEVTVCSFRVAIDRDFKNAEGKVDADFVQCVAYGKTAEFVAKWFGKGKMIQIINARFQTRTWTDENDKTHYGYEFVVDRVAFCGDGKKSDSTDGASESEDTYYQPDDEEMPY